MTWKKLFFAAVFELQRKGVIFAYNKDKGEFVIADFPKRHDRRKLQRRVEDKTFNKT